MPKVSTTLQFVAAEAGRLGRVVNQLVLPESPIKAACIGFDNGTAALGFAVSENEMAAIGELSDANGIEFIVEQDTINPGRWYLIHALEVEDLPLFGPIADDIADAVQVGNRIDALSALGDTMRRWLNFLRIARKGLNLEKQLGLWGELQTLCQTAKLVGWNDAIQAWVGPSHAAQDFNFGSWALEVKTTIHPRQVVKIASLEQLDDSPWEDLYLLHQTVTLVKPTEALTLKQFVQHIREDLLDREQMRVEFESLLTAAGYHSVHENRYNKQGITQETTTLYQISDGFPRILRDGLNPGILEAKYRVALHTASEFVRDPSTTSAAAKPLLSEIIK